MAHNRADGQAHEDTRTALRRTPIAASWRSRWADRRIHGCRGGGWDLGEFAGADLRRRAFAIAVTVIAVAVAIGAFLVI